MSHLIVDFPSTRREADQKARRQSVQFSSEMTIRFYERPDEFSLRDVHYSSGDYRRFKKENKCAVQEMHRRHHLWQESVNSGGCAGDDHIEAAFRECEHCGIENVLTPSLVEDTMARKTGCVNAVLDEQKRQDSTGRYDPERLARASLRYSRRAVCRSIKIGMIRQLI